jgi:hypothetical protein
VPGTCLLAFCLLPVQPWVQPWVCWCMLGVLVHAERHINARVLWHEQLLSPGTPAATCQPPASTAARSIHFTHNFIPTTTSSYQSPLLTH